MLVTLSAHARNLNLATETLIDTMAIDVLFLLDSGDRLHGNSAASNIPLTASV
jgi:hypothetical protein